MESYYHHIISDSESSTGGSSSMSTRTAPLASTTMFQCCECYRLFPTEAALLGHHVETNLLCSFATKALSFLQRFGFAQQAIQIPPPLPNPPTPPLFLPSPPQRHYHHLAPARLSLSLMLNTAEGSATHDPFGRDDDHRPPLETVDLLSQMNHDYAAPTRGYGGNEARYGEEGLDLELKL